MSTCNLSIHKVINTLNSFFSCYKSTSKTFLISILDSLLEFARPGSIESAVHKLCKVRSSMGDCHSFDPGSNPGPGAEHIVLAFL